MAEEIRGEEGTDVELLVQRKGKQRETVVLERKQIRTR